jgi:hypothetical protein
MEERAARRQRNRLLPGLVILYLLALALISLVAGFYSQQPSLPLPAYTASQDIATLTPTPVDVITPLPTTTPDYLVTLKETAVAIAGTLPTASPYPDWPQEKAVGFQMEDLMRRAYGTAVALYPRPPGYQPPLPETPATSPIPIPTEPIRPAGAGTLYDDGFDAVYSKQMRIASKWWETIGGQTLIVLAGRGFGNRDAQQGLLVIIVEDATHSVIAGPDVYLTPTRHGYAQVIDAEGERLTIRTEDGTLFYFEVPSRRWVNP